MIIRTEALQLIDTLWKAPLLVVILAIMAAPQSAAADEVPYPDGIGAAKLLMTLDQAKAAIPDLQVVEAKGDPPPPFAWEEAKLSGQQFGELKGCDVTLRFIEKLLIMFTCTCPDKSAAQAYLLKTYGKPGSQKPSNWQWPGPVRSIAYGPGNGVITVSDNKGNASFGTRLLFYYMAQPPKASATPSLADSAVPPQRFPRAKRATGN